MSFFRHRLTRALLVGVVTVAASSLAFLALLRHTENRREDAEADLIALSSSVAASFAASGSQTNAAEILEEMIHHPGIAAATLQRNGSKLTRRRAASPGSFLGARFRAAREPVVVCRETPQGTLCFESDPGHLQRAVGSDALPLLLLLPAALVLLLFMLPTRRRRADDDELARLTAVVRNAAREQNYTTRVTAVSPALREPAEAINTLLDQIHTRDLMLRRRNVEIEEVNRELESFAYSVSHDLRAPLGSIDGFSQALLEYCAPQLDDEAKEYVRWIRDASAQMKELVDALLHMARLTNKELNREEVDLSATAREIATTLQQSAAQRSVTFRIADDLRTEGDERLLRAVLENMLSNAWKFTSRKSDAVIEVGAMSRDGQRIYFVRDNGAGFDSTQAARMFTAFQRLHSRTEFEGTGIGLATAKRIIDRHGGTIWAEGETGKGATFFFTTGEARALQNETASDSRMTA
jgi:signal transduction histidine kinase